MIASSKVQPTVALLIWAALLTGIAAAADPPLDYTQNCSNVACHGGFAGRTVVHTPVRQNACDACHEVSDVANHKFKARGNLVELCGQCHDPFENAHLHKPVADGQCLTCHDPHGSSAKHLLTAESVGATCGQCHESITEDRDFLHGPVAAGDCTACHNAHGSEEVSLLIVPKDKVCATCHTDLVERMRGSPHKHTPASQNCGTCHDAHGGDNRMILKSRMPGLCTDCHDAVGEMMETAAFPHRALSTGEACGACHDPHASTLNHLLAAQSKEMCLSCHDKAMGAADRKVADIAQRLRDNPFHHGPLRQGDCTACHKSHGGEHSHLLADAYPSRLYAPFGENTYALCMTCHDSDAFSEASTETATGFRNGDRNLHFLHVNRPDKGRTCRVCHDPHAAKNAQYIVDSVPFGKWSIPLGYESTETGGSCNSGCHKPYRYDRLKPVTNLPPS